MKPTLARICAEVADRHGITVPDLLGPSRRREVARPRQMAMLLASELTTRSLPEIGRAIGGRDHTTIIHGVRTMRALVDREPVLAAAYRASREALFPTPAALLTAPWAHPQGESL